MRSELPAVADEKEDNAFVGHKIVTQYVDSTAKSNYKLRHEGEEAPVKLR